MKAYLEIRSQHRVGTWPKEGPDTYVAVQIVPDGEIKLKSLNHKIALLRGIRIVYCGEGYRNRCTSPKSMLNQAITKAQQIVFETNKE
jgi:hypothetical protein